MLEYEISAPRNDVDKAPLIVLMHGRGATRFDLVPLADRFPTHACVVFPEAPFNAAQWGYGVGSAWYRFMGGNRPEPESFSQSLDALNAFVTELQAEFAIDGERVVLGGFSQGGTMGIGYALAYPGTLAGVLNFSGFLADHPRVVASAETTGDTEFFWGHGRHDTSIPYQLALEGRAQLERAGARLTSRDYGIGHWIDAQELSDALAWLAAIQNPRAQ